MQALFESDADSMNLTRRHFLQSIRFPLLAVMVIWAVHLHQEIFGWDPGEYGIMSRRVWGLRGIFTGPIVHGSWGHLISNTVPLFVLTGICIYFYRKVARRAFWMIYFLTSISVWLFARPVSHIGASGVVYGLVAFIFWNGIFRRSLRSIILALIVMVFYSGMFVGILPAQEGISWESHLLGSIAGIITSFWYKQELEDDEADHRRDPFAAERGQEKKLFLPQDAFEKTKAQRLADWEEEARRRSQESGSGFPPNWNQNITW